MGWKSVLFGFATVVALCLGALAQSASGAAQEDTRQVTPVQLPLRTDQSAVPRGPEGMDGQPRYATMVPPVRDDAVERAPIAAPTQRVAVAPADAVGDPSQSGASQRYSTQTTPEKRVEQVTITGLRPSEDGMYRLGAGDKVHITVFNEGDLSGDFAVDGQGFVRLPLVGQVPAAGITTLGLEGRIADAFVNGGYLLNPRVAVEITNYRPFYIIGEIAKPGEYAYVNSMTAPNAIALAGGFTERASESTIWIRRLGDPKEREFQVDETTRIYPGDVIRVERSTYWSVIGLLAPLISPLSAMAYLLK
jgi:protein involved in polysaccharide export with SLBB domain